MSDDTRPSRLTVFGWAVAGGSGLALVVLAGIVVYTVRIVLLEAFVGLFLAVSLDPPVRWMVAHGWRRGRAVAVIFAAALIGLLLFLGVFLPPLVSEAAALVSDFPRYLARLRTEVPALTALNGLWSRLDQGLAALGSQFGPNALEAGLSVVDTISNVGLVAVLTVYFMADLPGIRGLAVGLLPERHRDRADHVLAVVADKAGSYTMGNLVISLITGVCAFVAMMLLHVPFAFPLAVFVALADLIPMIGATLGAVVCIVAALATTSLWPDTILLVAYFVTYQQIENYLIGPRVMRGSVQMPAVSVLLATLIGGSLLGLVGVLMSIPIAAALREVVTSGRDSQERAVVGEGPGR
ncbi:AI-2E family transporter [Streptosporangium sp. NPDC051022]|uniref:AI-2E family transporter n=1 Tax=Streptosporangium sp. NPDC051022 TaxID=3155752 RepID=UPI003415A09E